jgi:hypothetical protein
VISGINNQNFNYIQTDGDYVYLAGSFDAGAALVNGQYLFTAAGWDFTDIFFSRLRDCNATLTKQGRSHRFFWRKTFCTANATNGIWQHFNSIKKSFLYRICKD